MSICIQLTNTNIHSSKCMLMVNMLPMNSLAIMQTLVCRIMGFTCHKRVENNHFGYKSARKLMVAQDVGMISTHFDKMGVAYCVIFDFSNDECF